ncbi:MAG: type III-B CRISPR module RAMP protein Cmr6 [Promethearchaeota archaeon]
MSNKRSRDALSGIQGNNSKHSNPGLVLSRYSLDLVETGKINKILNDAINGCKKAYIIAYRRYKKCLEALQLNRPTKSEIFSTMKDCRLVVDLGDETVLETGLALNKTYGTPIIPGTALKGLASHYCHYIWGKQNEKFKIGGEYHGLIFGVGGDHAGEGAEAGFVTFNDAWITPESLPGSIRPDIMTPHHQDYNSGPTNKGFKAPSDEDMPIPIPFFSVRGKFLITLAIDTEVNDETGNKWLELGFSLIREALENWGIGGKTSSGYGRLIPDKGPARNYFEPKPIVTKPTGRDYEPQTFHPKNRGSLTPRQQPGKKKSLIYDVSNENLNGPNIEQKTPIKKVKKPTVQHKLDLSLLEEPEEDCINVCKAIWKVIQEKQLPLDLSKILREAKVERDYKTYFKKAKDAILEVLKAYHANDEYEVKEGMLKKK